MIVLDAYGNVADYLVPEGGFFMIPVRTYLARNADGIVELVAQLLPEPVQATPWPLQQALAQR